MIVKTLLGTLITVAALTASAIQISESGQAKSEIIVDEKASSTVRFAAEELQVWIEKISGAKVPILNVPGLAKNKIILGCPSESELIKNSTGKYQADLDKLKDNDGYAIRTEGDNIYIFASKPKGVLNGVFRFLFKNTDIIWARPNPEYGTVYSINPNLQFNQTDYIDIPKFVLRGWFMLLLFNAKGIPESELWEVRNCCNWNSGNVPPARQELWQKFGFVPEHGSGHNIVGKYITEKKYFDKHPEFFIMKDGERVRPSKFSGLTQLCFSNQEMTNAFIKELDEQIKVNPFYESYRIMIEDTWNSCECPECMKPITLPDGSIVNQKDVDFRSTQFFIWLNQIASDFYKKCPDKKILTFGYYFTEIPPRVKISPNISVVYCPIYKDSKQAIDGKSNEKWL